MLQPGVVAHSAASCRRSQPSTCSSTCRQSPSNRGGTLTWRRVGRCAASLRASSSTSCLPLFSHSPSSPTQSLLERQETGTSRSNPWGERERAAAAACQDGKHRRGWRRPLWSPGCGAMQGIAQLRALSCSRLPPAVNTTPTHQQPEGEGAVSSLTTLVHPRQAVRAVADKPHVGAAQDAGRLRRGSLRATVGETGGLGACKRIVG